MAQAEWMRFKSLLAAEFWAQETGRYVVECKDLEDDRGVIALLADDPTYGPE